LCYILTFIKNQKENATRRKIKYGPDIIHE
jgi:hypothetical protein